MKEFKIRCSAIGDIMGAKGLGKTGETYLKNWAKSQFFNRKIEIKSKYLSKGNLVEFESIKFIEKYLELGILEKNEQYFANDFLQGTPDIITDDYVIDVKNSWDWSTFPLFDTEIPNSDYAYQLQGYMELTGKRKALLVYILSDTPENIIEKEAYYFCKSQGFDELDYEIFEQFKSKMTYSDIADLKRFKVFELNYDESIIEKIKTRVIECKTYLGGLNV